jgi:phospholipid/cholesterol/gamma-HCH transport system ATP-binding protein
MIRFNNLVKKFGERTVLNGISFEVQEGEILFILGTSGTGKSVLLKNLVGLLNPDSGEIWVDGQNIVGLTEDQFLSIRRKVGMVFQQPALFDSLNVFENIAFGLKRLEKISGRLLRERVAESLKLVHLEGFEDRKVNSLSYGQQKRISLARTIALRPRVLLFDEPTTGLDPQMTTAINLLIKELSVELKTTSIVVSHDMKCALEIADRIIMLDQGQVIAEGTPIILKNHHHPLVQDFFAEVQ